MCILHAGIYGLFSNVDFLLGIALTHIHWYIAMFISESNLTVLALRMFSSGWLNITSTTSTGFLYSDFHTVVFTWRTALKQTWFYDMCTFMMIGLLSEDLTNQDLVHYWGFEELCEALVDTLCHLCLAKLHLFDQKYSNIVKYYSARAELSAHINLL